METERYKPKLSILIFLSVSHFFSRWGDRMWSFGVPLFLVVIHCNSLLLAAVYGLMLTVALTLFGTWVGDFVDATPRRKFVVLTLFLNNLFIFLNSVCLFIIILLTTKLSVSNWEPYFYFLIVLLIIFGAAARLTSLGTNISVEKDWVVVIAHKDKISLACINTNLRRIDLICKLVAPIFITMIMHFVGLLAATVVLAGWNMISFIVETLLINIVYKMEPNLAIKAYRHKEELAEENNSNGNNNIESIELTEPNNLDQDNLLDTPEIRQRTPKTKSNRSTKLFAKRIKGKLFSLPKNFITGWRIYWRQKVFLVGVSMASLYLTVLGFSGVTAGYFFTQGMTPFYLGLAQGVAGVIGVAATFAYPYIRRLTGAVRTGVIGISLQLFCLGFCVIGVFAPGNPTYGIPPPSAACIDSVNHTNSTFLPASNATSFINSTNTSFINNHTNTTANYPANTHQYASLLLMVTGVVTARFGLWLFDLAVLQIIQENVVESERGVVNGIMSSMNFFNDMLHFLLVVIFPLPSQFGYLALLSFVAITVAWILFFVYILRHEREALYCRRCWKYRARGYHMGTFEHDESSDDNSVRLEVSDTDQQYLNSDDDPI